MCTVIVKHYNILEKDDEIMRVNNNITALRTNVNLNRTHSRLDTAMYRLSSGYKINAAKDDPAGYAILRRMNQQIRGLDQANTNAADGVSAINTGEGALAEIQSMLQRINELAVQAANDTNATEDRDNIQDEIEQLKSEINRVAESTDYNGRTLLNGETERTSYIANPDGTLAGSISVLSQSTTVMPGEYKITIIEDAKKASVENFVLEAGTFQLNGETIEITQEDLDSGTAYSEIQAICERCAIDMERDGEKVTFTTKQYGSSAQIAIVNNTHTVNQTGSDVNAKISATSNGFSANAVMEVNAGIIRITDTNGFELRIETQSGAASGEQLTVKVLDASSMQIQIGSEPDNMMELIFEKISTKTLNINDINVRTRQGASDTIAAAQKAIDQISAIRSKLGAYENRLNYAIDNLETHSYNVSESASRIGDTDMAAEMTNYSQLNVLEQATSTILAKANQRPETVLQLLQS